MKEFIIKESILEGYIYEIVQIGDILLQFDWPGWVKERQNERFMFQALPSFYNLSSVRC